MAQAATSRQEHIIPVNAENARSPAPGVEVHQFVSAATGATNFSTLLAIFQPGATLPYHTHDCSEAITVVEGPLSLAVAGRSYVLEAHDCLHVPAGVPHTAHNAGAGRVVTHSAFGSAAPARNFITQPFPVVDRGAGMPEPQDPEHLVRFASAPSYELAPNTKFTDLFNAHLGAKGICGGFGRFQPGASLSCHTHAYDESITIVAGKATCMVHGHHYPVSDYTTAHIPKGFPHRFLNETAEEMHMIWVYAGDLPDRKIVDNGFCTGVLPMEA